MLFLEIAASINRHVYYPLL